MRLNYLAQNDVSLNTHQADATMKTTAETTASEDPLGYQRFALTESAYDLINSLTGIYARLVFLEEKHSEPNKSKIAVWDKRVDDLQHIIHKQDWSDLGYLNNLVSELTVEYKTNIGLEAGWENKDASINPKPVHTF